MTVGELWFIVQNPDTPSLWDGRSSDGRSLPMDSYYFVIDLHDEGSEPITGT